MEIQVYLQPDNVKIKSISNIDQIPLIVLLSVRKSVIWFWVDSRSLLISPMSFLSKSRRDSFWLMEFRSSTSRPIRPTSSVCSQVFWNHVCNDLWPFRQTLISHTLFWQTTLDIFLIISNNYMSNNSLICN